MSAVEATRESDRSLRQVCYEESVVRVGTPVPLNGVLTNSRLGKGAQSELCVVMLNSGLLHHVGTCGLSVRLARSLANLGIPSVRFDFSGIGDSPPRRSSGDYRDRMDAEVIEIMDHAQQATGAQMFILFGLCSGAFGSFTAAQKDHRVVGVIQIAPHSFRTPKWYLNHYAAKLRRVPRFLRRLLQKVQPDEKSTTPDAVDVIQYEVDSDSEPTRAEISGGYAKLLGRGVRFLVLMTQGESETYNYQGQMREMLPDIEFGDYLEEHFFPRTRHIITEPEDQQQIVQLMVDWCGRHLGPRPNG